MIFCLQSYKIFSTKMVNSEYIFPFPVPISYNTCHIKSRMPVVISQTSSVPEVNPMFLTVVLMNGRPMNVEVTKLP